MRYKLLLALIAACASCAGRVHAYDGYFDSKGVKIHYVTAGEGEPVVLIHGWMGDSTMWGRRDASGNVQLDPSPGFEAIALDCRGHGKSGKPHDPGMYGIEMAEDVVRLLDYLKIKKAHLIGYSMGAFIAGKVAASHPERVLSVVYGGQAPILAGQSSTGSNEVKVFAKAVDEGKGLGAYILYVWPADKPKPTMEQANSIADFMVRGKDAKALALAGLSLGDLAVKPEDLSRGKAPCLFIYGEKESAYVTNSVAAARKFLVGSEVKVVPGGDHISTLVKPEFAASILAFLKAHK
ncbi:MAG TPA: alpha/beta hydrolase [Fimbriimonadaceae bacterium]|nr:alpha/beta hydrolase [Fimbriimonadaceae bacterium]